MGITLALILHIVGAIAAAIFVYFFTPYFAKLLGMEIIFVYIVVYSLLAVWSVREALSIETGRHKKANELSEIPDKEKQ